MNDNRSIAGFAAAASVTIPIAMGLGCADHVASPHGVPGHSPIPVGIATSLAFEVDDTFIVASPTFLELAPDGSELYVGPFGSGGDARRFLRIVDPDAGTVMDSIQIDQQIRFDREVPLDLDITPDGARAYIPADRARRTGVNRVEVLDIVNRSHVTSIVDPGNPDFGYQGTAPHPDGTRFYLAHGAPSARVEVVLTSTNQLLASVGFGSSPSIVELAVTPDGSRVYAFDRGNNTGRAQVFVIDAATHTHTTTIQTGMPPGRSLADVDIVSDGTRAYLLNSTTSLGVLDTDPASPTFNQPLAVIPTPYPMVRKAAISANDKMLLATVTIDDFTPGFVAVFDIDPTSPAFHTLIGTVEVGINPVDILITGVADPVVYVAVPSIGGIQVLRLSAVSGLTDLMASVQALIDSGALSQGNGNALLATLSQALNSIVSDRPNAVSLLEAFVNQVEGFVAGGILEPDDAAPLLEAAEELIELLSARAG